jgi:hypothetical protein
MPKVTLCLSLFYSSVLKQRICPLREASFQFHNMGLKLRLTELKMQETK